MQREWKGGFESVVSAKDACDPTGKTTRIEENAFTKGARHERSGITQQAGADALPDLFCVRSTLSALSKNRHDICRKRLISKPTPCHGQPPVCHEVSDKSSHDGTGRQSSPLTRQQAALFEWLSKALVALPHRVSREHFLSL